MQGRAGWGRVPMKLFQRINGSVRLRKVNALWREADQRIAEFDATGLAYDRYRPRYPEPLFDDLMALAGLRPGDRAVEIGAGTGIATLPLAARGLRVTAVEPAASMSEILKAKVGVTADVIEGRFEETAIRAAVDLVAAFNSWHWVEPAVGVARLVEMLRPGGVVTLVWTEVISWGRDPFGARLAEVTGQPWVGRLAEIVNSKDAVAGHDRLASMGQRRYRFERTLTAQTFVDVTRTYGGHPGDEQLVQIEAVIDGEFNGAVTKVEEAVLHAYKRL